MKCTLIYIWMLCKTLALSLAVYMYLNVHHYILFIKPLYRSTCWTMTTKKWPLREPLCTYLERLDWTTLSHVKMQILRYHTFDGVAHYEYQLDAFVHLFDPLWNASCAEVLGCLLDGELITLWLWHLFAVISKTPTILFICVKEMKLSCWSYNIRMYGLEEGQQRSCARLPLTDDDALWKTFLRLSVWADFTLNCWSLNNRIGIASVIWFWIGIEICLDCLLVKHKHHNNTTTNHQP